MTKKEIMENIEITAGTLDNGDYDVNWELTEELIYSKHRDEEDFDEENYGGVIVEKGKDGTVYTYIDDYSVYPIKYTAEVFAEYFAI